MSDLPKDQDPTALTTAQLLRELANVELRLNEKIESIKETARILHEDYTRVPTLLDRASTEINNLFSERILHLQDVTNEKFTRVETQFGEKEKRDMQAKLAADTGIAAAMAAAEKAVGENNRSFAAAVAKSEKNTEDALKSLDNQFKTEIRSMAEKLSDIGSRQARNDGSSATMMSIGAGAMAIMSLIIAAYAAFHIGSPTPVISYAPAPTAVPAPVTVPR